MEWLKLSIWIGTYGFLKEYRPEDPYITQYLTHAPMNFTDEEVSFKQNYSSFEWKPESVLVIIFLKFSGVPRNFSDRHIRIAFAANSRISVDRLAAL